LNLLTPSLKSLLIKINCNSSQSIYYRGLAPILFSCLNSLTTSELSEHSHMASLYKFGKNRIEITTSNSSSIIVCLFVSAETCWGPVTRQRISSIVNTVISGMCLPNRCLTMVICVTLYISDLFKNCGPRHNSCKFISLKNWCTLQFH
jgi:hypothetical protein